MRSSLAQCAVVLVTVVGLSGCKSGGMRMPHWSNPFAKSTPSADASDLPTANATPTPPKGGYASATADSEAPRFTGSAVTPSSYDAPTSQGPVVSRSPLDYAPPGSTVSADDSYMAPQVGRYDTGGGYGSVATTPSYNDPPPYVASRSGAARSAAGDYSAANSYDRYGSNAAASTGNYSPERYQPAPGYDTAPSAGPAPGYQQNPYTGPAPNPAPNWGTGTGTPFAPPTAGNRAADADVTPPVASTEGSRLSDFVPDRPWNRNTTSAPASNGPASSFDSSATRGGSLGGSGYDPGNTGYNPGDTGYDPGRTSYNPPNTPNYEPPAPPYTSPAPSYRSPAADATAPPAEWQPGSIKRYPLSGSSTGNTGDSTPNASASYPNTTGGAVPNSYFNGPSASAL